MEIKHWRNQINLKKCDFYLWDSKIVQKNDRGSLTNSLSIYSEGRVKKKLECTADKYCDTLSNNNFYIHCCGS